jgi:hypothetical protein
MTNNGTTTQPPRLPQGGSGTSQPTGQRSQRVGLGKFATPDEAHRRRMARLECLRLAQSASPDVDKVLKRAWEYEQFIYNEDEHAQ